MTQSCPTDQTYNEHRVQNLPFEIIAVPQNVTINQPSNKNIPLNFKIRIKRKKEPKLKQAIISMPKLNITQRTKNVRLVNSDQTIMSFDLFMNPHNDKIPPKKTDRFFFNIFKPGCLMQNDKDDVPYMPSVSHDTSEMQDVYSDSINDWTLNVTEKFALRKNIIPPSNTSNSPKTFFGLSKAGGCLDPPFSEDKYAYKPTSVSPNTIQLNSDISNTSTQYIHNKSLDDSIFDSQKSKEIRDSAISDSLITYPQDISINETKNYEESQNISFEQTNNNTRLQDGEFTDLYYMPPRNTNIKKTYEENQNRKYIDRKEILENQHEMTTSVVDFSLLTSNEIKMTKPELTNQNLLENFKSDKKIIAESTTDVKTKSTDINNQLHTSLEHKYNKIDYISKREAREIIDNLIDTIIIPEKREFEQLSATTKKPLDTYIDIINDKKEKHDLRELKNGIRSDPTINISSSSKDILAGNLKLGYENDISIRKSIQVDAKRKVTRSEESNIVENQLSSSLDMFDNRSEIQVKLRDENSNTFNIENTISKSMSSPEEKHLEKSNEQYKMPIQNKNIEFLATDDIIVEINKIQQSPQQSLQTLRNTDIISDVHIAEELSIKSKDDQYSETPSAAFSKDFNNMQSITSKTKTDIDGKLIEQDIHLHNFNETTKLMTESTENYINDVRSTITLNISTTSELNTSIKSVNGRMTKSEEFTNIYNPLNKQKHQEENAIEEDIVVQGSRMSLSVSEATVYLLKKSGDISNTKKSRSDDVIVNKMLETPKDENEKYYNVVDDDIPNKQRDSSEETLSHQITKIKNVDLEKSIERNSRIIDKLSEKKQLYEYQQKTLDIRNSEDVDISSLRMKGTDSNNFVQTLLLESESSININVKDHKASTHSVTKDVSDVLAFDKETLYEHNITKSDPVTKKYTSTSLHSIAASRKTLQKNMDAARHDTFPWGLESNVLNQQNDKIKSEDFSLSSDKFKNKQKNADDFMTITNTDLLIENNNGVNNVEPARNTSATDSYSKFNVSPLSISLSLNFHISNNNDKNIVFIKTFDSVLPPEKRLEDKFVSAKYVVTENDKEIKMPITSDYDLTLVIKKKTSTRKVINQTNEIGKTVSERNVHNDLLFHNTLNSVYKNLFPLKEIINDLRHEMKLLLQQQIQFKELSNKLGTKSLRLIDVNHQCKCQKQAFSIYYE